MGLIFDTNVFINFEHGRVSEHRFERLIADNDAYIAAITISELLVGVFLADDIKIRIGRAKFIEAVTKDVPVLDFTADVAKIHAELHAHLIRAGIRADAHPHDLQIGATAIAHGHSVLTSNGADFHRIPGVDVVTL